MNREISTAERFDTAMEGLKYVDYGHGQPIKQAIKDEFGVDLDDDVAKALSLLNREVLVAEPGQNVERLKNKDDEGKGDDEKVGNVLTEVAGSGGDVYMGISLNQQKSRVAWDMGREDPDGETGNYVVEVPEDSPPTGQKRSDWYDLFAEYLGWKRLADIDLRNLYEYPISDKEYNDLLEEMGIADANTADEDMKETVERAPPTPPEEEELNVSVSSKSKKQKWFKSKYIKEAFEQDETISFTRRQSYTSNITYNIGKLILFPSNADQNISDFYWLGGNYGGVYTALANSNVGTYEYLSDLDEVCHVDDFVKQAWRTPIETTKGATTVAQSRSNLVVHIVPEEAKEYFVRVMDDMPRGIESVYETEHHRKISRKSWNGPEADEMAYAPLTMEEVHDVAPALRQAEVPVLYADKTPHCFKSEQKNDAYNDLWLYASARMSNWNLSSVEMAALLSGEVRSDLTEGGYELVESMAYRHDDDLQPVSEK